MAHESKTHFECQFMLLKSELTYLNWSGPYETDPHENGSKCSPLETTAVYLDILIVSQFRQDYYLLSEPCFNIDM